MSRSIYFCCVSRIELNFYTFYFKNAESSQLDILYTIWPAKLRGGIKELQ